MTGQLSSIDRKKIFMDFHDHLDSLGDEEFLDELESAKDSWVFSAFNDISKKITWHTWGTSRKINFTFLLKKEINKIVKNHQIISTSQVIIKNQLYGTGNFTIKILNRVKIEEPISAEVGDNHRILKESKLSSQIKQNFKAKSRQTSNQQTQNSYHSNNSKLKRRSRLSKDKLISTRLSFIHR